MFSRYQVLWRVIEPHGGLHSLTGAARQVGGNKRCLHHATARVVESVDDPGGVRLADWITRVAADALDLTMPS
jgi:hypothetical protein